MNYQAVIFDLDGTLLNTLDDLMAAVNYGLGRLGLPPHGPEEFKYFVGSGRDVMAARALPQDKRDPETVRKLCEYVDSFYMEHWIDHTRPYTGIPELLNFLTARKLHMAVLSNKPHNFTVLNISKLLAPWHFEIVLGATDSMPKKPDCTSALHIARQLAIAPAEFVYLGDSDVDMETALNAGMYPVGACWGFRTVGELKASGAKKLIQKPLELMELFA
jgi:phosphoglycolate phosphatase